MHGCIVYTECAKTAVVLCGTSHASASVDIRRKTKERKKKKEKKKKKKRSIKRYSLMLNHIHASAVSLLESGD